LDEDKNIQENLEKTIEFKPCTQTKDNKAKKALFASNKNVETFSKKFGLCLDLSDDEMKQITF
jgi:hypothetical protein